MFVLVSNNCQKVPSFHFEYSLSRYPDQNWVYFDRSAQEATTHCKKSTLAFGDCFATTFCFFFTFQLKRNFSLSCIQKNLVSRSLNLHLLLDFFFLLLFTLYKKWLLLNLVCLQSRPRFYPTLVGFPPAYCFTYIYSFVSFFSAIF